MQAVFENLLKRALEELPPQAGAWPSFAGCPLPSAEWQVRRHRGAPNLDLPARKAGVEAAMVAALEHGGRARKQKAGQILLTVGGVALILQLWVLWLEVGAAWSHGAADSLGWLGTLGVAMLQMVDFIAWNPNGILLSIARVLLLCWPMAVMLAGVALSRRTN